MKKFDWVLFISSLMLPLIPLLFLFNQNSEYLYFPIIAITGIILILLIAIYYIIIRFLYKSNGIAFIACLNFVILIFALDSIYNAYAKFGISTVSPIYFFVLTPLISYIITYMIYRITNRITFPNLSKFILIFLAIMLGMNTFPLSYNLKTASDNNIEFKYKLSFNVDKQLKSPNVYLFFCDGLLGFKAMEKYFSDSQDELSLALANRGFKVNKEAMLESGRRTAIAIPALMCPDYHDKYLKGILENHEDAMKLSMASDNLYNSRVYNETINAFDAKGYRTITLSINDVYFFPTTDFFYFINRSGNTNKGEYIDKPYYVENEYNSFNKNDKLRLYAYQLGEIFLAGLPGILFDKIHEETVMHQITTKYPFISDVLLGNVGHEADYALVESLYDTIKSKDIKEPKFVTVHFLLPHFPFYFNEKGEEINDTQNILNYKGHHTYSTKVLVNLIDMVLKEDSNAVIILQADHGLHIHTERHIIKAFGNEEAVFDIWNNVFSAIRVPDKYKTGQEHYTMQDPRNISRYLVNSFVGENYNYIVNEIEIK